VEEEEIPKTTQALFFGMTVTKEDGFITLGLNPPREMETSPGVRSWIWKCSAHWSVIGSSL